MNIDSLMSLTFQFAVYRHALVPQLMKIGSSPIETI